MNSVNDLLGTVDKAIFGRVTFQLFENYWPAVGKAKMPRIQMLNLPA
jgi:hypothetical protein